MRTTRVVLLAALATLVAGGGVLAFLYLGLDWALFEESEREVRVRYVPEFAEKREQLKRLVNNLPPPGATPPTVGPVPFDPPLGVDPKTRQDSFTGAMDYECLNPDDTSHIIDWWHGTKFRVAVSGGPTLVEEVRRMREGAVQGGQLRKRGQYTAARCEEMLAKPYLVICRTVSYTKPVAVPEQKAFHPGRVDVEAFAFDLRDDSLKACVRVRAENVAQEVAVATEAPRSDAVQKLARELAKLVGEDARLQFKALNGPKP